MAELNQNGHVYVGHCCKARIVEAQLHTYERLLNLSQSRLEIAKRDADDNIHMLQLELADQAATANAEGKVHNAHTGLCWQLVQIGCLTCTGCKLLVLRTCAIASTLQHCSFYI